MGKMEIKKRRGHFPCRVFRVKAKQIQATSQKIGHDFTGKTPNTIENLLKLPGVWRKTANLVVTLGYKKSVEFV
ncbi:MAG: hypothetical protein KC592_00115 [Nitrospira sp.]|nr:hypothetical protein [Nitrospira sp.]HBP86229.1 hypothetical protein [Nitrospiraceae bacterium]HNP30035.1 hypothetical protein [Nitrospirales bacterium]